MTHDWWKTLFHGSMLEAWRRLPTAEQNRAETDFLVRELALPPGGQVLDVACGFGRLALELAGRGVAVTGADLCAEYLDEARAAAAQRAVPATFHHQDMRTLPWQAAFDGAYCFGNSFAYFDDADNAATLAGIARALRPGARLVLDTFCSETVLPTLQERRWFAIGDLHLLIATRYDVAAQCLESQYTVLQGGHTQTATAVYRCYSFRDLVELLGAAGFTAVRGLADLAGRPLELRAPRCLLVATRAADATRSPTTR